VLDKAEYSAFESTLNSLYRIVSYCKDGRTKLTYKCRPTLQHISPSAVGRQTYGTRRFSQSRLWQQKQWQNFWRLTARV